ncbi:MAG: NAD(P)-binding protein [Bdellovibrionota bacterium]
MARKKYDIAVIGAGLNGLIITHSLAKAGKKVILVESADRLGGVFQEHNMKLGKLPDFFSNQKYFSEAAENFSRWCSRLFGEETAFVKVNPSTKTFDSGKFKDFIGFGDKAPVFVDELTAYTNTEKLQMQTSFSSITQSYIQELEALENVDILTNSILTAFHPLEGQIDLIEVNDGKKIEADEYVFTGSLFSLDSLSEEVEVLTKSQKQSLAKANSFTAVHLEFVHPGNELPIEEDFVLSAAKEKSQACYGQFSLADNFSGAQAEAYQMSTWLSFVESNLTNDMETTGNLVREMKRQVKRAFPEAIDNAVFERVVVTPDSHCTNKVKVKDLKSTNFPNFYILSKELDESDGIMGRVKTAVDFLDEKDISLSSFSAVEDVDIVDKAVDKNENTHSPEL